MLPEYDPVSQPYHYNQGKFGDVECIEFTRLMTGNFANAFKYVWRHEDKDKPKEDLKKSLWYVRDAAEHDIMPFYSSSESKKAKELAAHFLIPALGEMEVMGPYAILGEIALAGLRPSPSFYSLCTSILEKEIERF